MTLRLAVGTVQSACVEIRHQIGPSPTQKKGAVIRGLALRNREGNSIRTLGRFCDISFALRHWFPKYLALQQECPRASGLRPPSPWPPRKLNDKSFSRRAR